LRSNTFTLAKSAAKWRAHSTAQQAEFKANLERLLARRPEGIFVNPFEQGEIGPDLFRKACEFGFEGLVSKHRDRPYRAGRLRKLLFFNPAI